MTQATAGWATQQLAEFLEAVSSYHDGPAAIRGAVEWAAEALDAEIGAVVRDGAVVAAVGFGREEIDAGRLAAVARGSQTTLTVAGLGELNAVTVAVDAPPAGHLVVARAGGDTFTMEEVALLRAMGRCLSLSLRTLTTLEAERELRVTLRESERSFRLLFAANPQPMWVWDTETLLFLAVNDAALAKYGYSRDEFLAMRITDIRDPEAVPAFLGQVEAIGPDELVVADARHRLRDGRKIDVEIAARRQPFAGRPAMLVLAQDVTERKALEEQLRHQAFHDPLTKLANRALWRDRVEHALERRSRDRASVAVLVIDLDGFKAVNDTLGHSAGDAVLVAVAERLVATVRQGDTPAHIGGDEFAVLIEGAQLEEARTVGQRILDALQAPYAVGGRECFVGASIGLAVCGDDHVDAEALRRDADLAMYAAKTNGKGRLEVYEPSLHRGTMRRMEMGRELRWAVEREELVLQYQPVFSLSSGEVEGVEALLRWRHPTKGLVSPADFIPVAEETGLIVQIGAWVLSEACRQLRTWQREILGERPLTVAVNVSTRQLRERTFEEMVVSALLAAGIAPHDLVLEVTESALVDDMASVSELLQTLRARGVRIAMDDFGAGYSSLAYLRGLPLDVVKIDRMFLTGLGTVRSDSSLTLAIVRLLETLDVRTVAEGIETREQLDYVRAMGIDAGQGYLLCRPLDADAFGEALARGAGHLVEPPPAPSSHDAVRRRRLEGVWLGEAGAGVRHLGPAPRSAAS